MRPVATPRSEMAAAVIRGRLEEAGIRCVERSESWEGYGPGACSILVEEQDVQRARAVLRDDDGGFDEEELARLSEESAEHALRDAPSARAADAGPQVRRVRHTLGGLLRRRGREGPPGDPFGR